MVVSYLNFVFFIKIKAKSNYRILNFVFQFIKKTKWHFGYTDSVSVESALMLFLLIQNFLGPTVYKKRKAWNKTREKYMLVKKTKFSRKDRGSYYKEERLE